MLPIDEVLPALRAALASAPHVILEAPPGAGKTTRVPLALRDAAWLGGQRIVMLEPRRLAARAASHRMASLLGETTGQTVGHRMRRDTRVGPATRVEVVTEGVLTRMLQADPVLEGVGLVIFDEFHERSLVADAGLALTLASATLLRPDLRILVMTATPDVASLRRVLPDAPLVRSEGRMHPVEVLHRAAPRGLGVEPHVVQVVREALERHAGSVLVFLAGAAQIQRVASMLDGTLPVGTTLHQLFGAMDAAAQDAAIAPPARGMRKVVLATSIAETSLTIEGITVVVDSGWTRASRFSPRTGMTRLETVRVTRDAAAQRAGRAGRTEPGTCYRCWSVADEAGLVPHARAEILEADLAPLLLDAVVAGHPDVLSLRWIDAPPAAGVAVARDLLMLLGALDARGQLTAHGAAIAAVGTHPRLAHMLVTAATHGGATLSRAAALVALLEDRDPMQRADGPAPADVSLRLDAIQGRSVAAIDRGALARLRDAARDWSRRLPVTGNAEALTDGALVALAYPDRIAQRRGAPGRFVLRNGRGVMLPSHDALAHAPWLAVASVDDAGRDGRVQLAAPLDLSELGDELLHVEVSERTDVDAASGTIATRRRTMLGALVVREQVFPVDAEHVAAAVIAHVREHGIDALPLGDAGQRIRERVRFCRMLDPSWPDMGDVALLDAAGQWLAPFLPGIRRLGDLGRVDWSEALLTMLDHRQRTLLRELAPERITLPSGSTAAVDYSDPAAPVLAARIQELFGWAASPVIGGGRVTLMLHLLSPARRPVQVTRDLAGFWRSGYFEVRKELRGRYPKHDWPGDPVTAVARRRG